MTKIEELVKSVGTDVSGKWVDAAKVEELINLVLKDCANAVKNTGKQCAFTTHDVGIVECTIQKCVQSVQDLYK